METSERSESSLAKKPSLRKAVETLAIVPSNRRISLLSRKIYNVMLHHAQRQGIDKSIFRCSLRDIVRGLDFNSNNTEVLKNHLREMVTTKVEWQAPTPAEGMRWSVSALISHADLVTERGEVRIEWSYAPNIRDQLLGPNRYAQVSLLFVAALRSYAAVALYEICSRYVNNPSHLTARQSWQWWRPVLTGAPISELEEGGRAEYKYFKRDVLKPAIAEVNSITDLYIELLEHKQGRAVDEIQFRVSRPSQSQLPLDQAPQPINLEVVGLAVRLGVHQERAEALLEKFGERAVRVGLDQLQERKGRAWLAPVVSPERFLASLVKAAASQGDALEVQGTVHEPLPRSSQPQPQPPRDERSARIALLEEYRDEQRRNALAMFESLDQADREKWGRRFSSEYLPTVNRGLQRIYERDGITHAGLRSLFAQFVARETWGPTWDKPDEAELLAFSLGER